VGGPEILVKDAEGRGKAEGRIITTIMANKSRSENVRRARYAQNRVNWSYLHGEQDWGHKIDGQSRIFLPDLPLSIYRMAAAIENQLVNFENWFAIERSGGLQLFDSDSMRMLVQHVFERLWQPGDTDREVPDAPRRRDHHRVAGERDHAQGLRGGRRASDLHAGERGPEPPGGDGERR
jgi:hypothetical protein